jgi:hypothetical protein
MATPCETENGRSHYLAGSLEQRCPCERPTISQGHLCSRLSEKWRLYLEPRFKRFILATKVQKVDSSMSSSSGAVQSPNLASQITESFSQITESFSQITESLSLSLRQIPERDDLGPPVVPGGRRSVWDPETFPRAAGSAVSKERLGDWDGQMHV